MASTLIKQMRDDQKTLTQEMSGLRQEIQNKYEEYLKKFDDFMEKVNVMIKCWKDDDERKRKEQERKIVELRVEVEQFKRGTNESDKSDLIKEMKDLRVTVDKMSQSQPTPASDEISYINAQVTYLANDLAEIKYQQRGEAEESCSRIKKVDEDVVIMKQQAKDLKEVVGKLRQDQQQQQQQRQEQQQQQQHQQQQTIESSTAPTTTTASFFNNICNELEQRQLKRNNLILFGLMEGTKADGEMASQLIEDVAVTARVKSCYRLGKQSESSARPRPLVIKFSSVEEKSEVQRSLRNLKGKSEWKGVSIRPDLTKMQYQEEKQMFEELCQEMKIKNENLQGGGKWKIVNWDGVQKLLFLDNI